MNILITGAQGFIGKNLVCTLKNIRDGKDKTHGNIAINKIYEYGTASTEAELREYCTDCDFVFNLAGVNRPQSILEFEKGNYSFVVKLTSVLKALGNHCPILMSSSIQAELDNPYGCSKRLGEKAIFEYSRETGAEVLVYRLPNVFGKWCKPNYNSAVATFCHNIANDLDITVNDPNTNMTLVYIDDVVDEFIRALQGDTCNCGKFYRVQMEYKTSLGKIVELLDSFKKQPQTLIIPDIPKDSFAKKLYSTYLSYLPKERIAFPLKMNSDDRGSFTELIKTTSCGQFSVNVSKPKITKGQHWHNTKWEFFIVVSGRGLIQQRKIGTDEVLEFEVCGSKLEAVHMLPGYTHNIINLSDTENLVTVMWSNEQFDSTHPDTFWEEV